MPWPTTWQPIASFTAIIGPFDSAFQVSICSHLRVPLPHQPEHLDLHPEAEPVTTVLADDGGVLLEAQRRPLVLDAIIVKPPSAVAAPHRNQPDQPDSRPAIACS